MTKRSRFRQREPIVIDLRAKFAKLGDTLNSSSRIALRTSLNNERANPVVTPGPTQQELKLEAAKRKISTRLTHIQAADVIAKIRECYDQELGNYKDGHTDISLAGTMAFPCSDVSVSALRRDLYGNFQPLPPKAAASLEAMDARLGRIEEFLSSNLGFAL